MFFNHEFDLLEQIFPERAVGVPQQQFARGAHALDRGLGRRAVGVAERMPFAQPVHPFAVVALEGFPFAQLELGVADADVAAEGFECYGGRRSPF